MKGSSAATSSECSIDQSDRELTLKSRWVSKTAGVLILAVLLSTVAGMLLDSHAIAVVIVACVLLYFGCMLALNWHVAKVGAGQVETFSGPIPFFVWRRRTYSTNQADEVIWRYLRTPTGRGGYVERFTLEIRVRDRQMPIELMQMRQPRDAELAADALATWLNSQRRAGQAPLQVRQIDKRLSGKSGDLSQKA